MLYIADVSKTSSKLPKYPLSQCYSIDSDFLQRLVINLRSFLQEEDISCQTQTSITNRVNCQKKTGQDGPYKPKEKIRGRSWHCHHTSLLAFGLGTLNLIQRPLKSVKRFPQISVDCGRDHPEAEEQLTQHLTNSQLLISLQCEMTAMPCTLHTLYTCHTCQGSAGLAKPLFAWAREMGLTRTEPGRGKVRSKSFFFTLQKCSYQVETAQRLQNSMVFIAAVFPVSGLSRKRTSDKVAGLLMGFPCQGPLIPHFVHLPLSFAEV